MKRGIYLLLLMAGVACGHGRGDANPGEAKGVPKVSIIMTLDKETYAFGELPKAKVVLKNESDENVVLARSLDGSEVGWRFPKCGIEVFDENKEKVQLGGIARCGNMNTLRDGDFVELEPGETLTLAENAGFYAFYQLSQKPGTHWVRYSYATSSGGVEKYFGDERMMPGHKVDPALREMAARIPEISVMSEMVKVVVLPKEE